jgi:Patatin-like phospholipase
MAQSSSKWDKNDGAFHLGINMAGAISAGAYTAGVLDFLMQALEQWYIAKKAQKAVPMHDVSIDVFSGASAGGMCAAIASVMVQNTFDHIDNPEDPNRVGTTNIFYESWVNKIDIEPLLGDRDLAAGGPVVSLLDSSIINDIASFALVPRPADPPRYISKSLTLFLTLTNVRGTPFKLVGEADGSAEENIAYYADKLQFETVQGNNPPTATSAWPLPAGVNGGGWPLLKEAAKATGAFPLFLAPRKIERNASDYFRSPWEPLSVLDPPQVDPNWPLKPADKITTLNVDGGVTDNNPFELAHDFLALHNPLARKNPDTGELENPRPADQANAAVLTVAPFPADDVFKEDYKFDENASVFGMLPNLFTVLISQSRFLGESLTAVVSGASATRFTLAPKDEKNLGGKALLCGTLGAFGGFFERGFRAHDYQLGRRNCQRFLQEHFQLPVTNPIIDAGLKKLDDAARKVVAPDGTAFIPIIPLCGTALDTVLPPKPAKITSDRVDKIVGLAVKRLKAVAKPLFEGFFKTGLEEFAADKAINLLIDTLGKKKLEDAIRKELDGLISN